MSGESECILAVDCGSTNLKVGVFDGDLRCLGKWSAPVEYSVADGMRFEMPVKSLSAGFLSLCENARRSSVEHGSRITMVSFGSQAQTFCVLDGNGEPKMDFISWMDKRAGEESEELNALFWDRFHRHCSFSACLPQLQIAKLLWLQRHSGERMADGDQIVSLPTYFGMLLGGSHVTDENLAAMGGIYSLTEQGWWDEGRSACGIPIEALGRVVPVGKGIWSQSDSARDGTDARVKIFYSGNDQTVGAYGNGCRDGGMVVTLGTALVVYRFAGYAPGPFTQDGCWGPYPGGGFYELVTRDEGCKALDWAMDKLLGKRAPRDFDELARSAWHADQRAREVLFLPDKAYSNDAWTGKTDPAGSAYAVLEGISFSLKELIENDLKVNKPGGSIKVTGGGSQSSVWLDILANVLGADIVVGTGDALSGAAAVALGRSVNAQAESITKWKPRKLRVQELQERYELWKSRRRL